MAIGTEPRVSNLSTAPACSSYSTSPLYDDPEWQVPATGNCTTVAAIIVDERAPTQDSSAGGGLWKLVTGDESQVGFFAEENLVQGS